MRRDHFEKTKNLLKQYNIRAKKGLGQNFLVDSNVLELIIEKAEIDPRNLIVEIGPGLGTLTEMLADQGDFVVAVEIDDRMVGILQETVGARGNVAIVHQDFLVTNVQELFRTYRPHNDSSYQIIANLPYYISTPIIEKIINARENLANAVIMLQKEVAERIAAKPGGKAYGSLTVAVQYYMKTEIVGLVPKESFIPAPKVESAILKLTPHEQKIVKVQDEDLFFQLIYDSFRQRRKTLLNNLRQSTALTQLNNGVLKKALSIAGIQEGRRGETVSIEEFACLANVLSDYLDDESR